MEKKVIDIIKQLGYCEPDEKQENRVNEWLEWFGGTTKKHNYFVYNGKKKCKKRYKSLNMASQVCGDLSDFFFNEKLDITIDKENIENEIKSCLEANDFLFEANGLMQLVKALGTGALIPYLDNGELKINYIPATNLVILDNDSILTWSISNVKGGEELYINAHILEGDKQAKEYVIYNFKFFRTDGASGWEELELDEKEKEIHTHSLVKKFAILKTAEKNNIDINSPYGISCFANAIDPLLSVDKAFDSLDNEIDIGRKRVYVKGGASKFNTDADGNMTPIFDPSDVAFYELPGEDGDKMLTESSFDLRIEELNKALQTQVNLLSSKVGLGQNYYKVVDGQVYVNTDNVMSSNSDVYRKIKKQENIITNSIKDLIHGIAELKGMSQDFDISVFYDDSIIEDTEKIRQQAQTEYNSGLISKAQYYRDVYKLGDKEAIDFANQMNEEIQNEQITDGTEFDVVE